MDSFTLDLDFFHFFVKILDGLLSVRSVLNLYSTGFHPLSVGHLGEDHLVVSGCTPDSQSSV